MRKADLPKAASIPAMILPVLLGTGVALALLFLSAFLVAALIWGGVLPADNPSLFLTVCAGVCAFIGGRVAIGKGSGQAMLTGALTAAVVCVALLLIIRSRGACVSHAVGCGPDDDHGRGLPFRHVWKKT